MNIDQSSLEKAMVEAGIKRMCERPWGKNISPPYFLPEITTGLQICMFQRRIKELLDIPEQDRTEEQQRNLREVQSIRDQLWCTLQISPGT